MSRKDYVAFANAFNTATASTPEAEQLRQELAKEAARIFANDNPRFDRARFLAACRVPE